MIKGKIIKALIITLIMILSIMLSGCGESQEAPKELTKKILKLKWLHQAQFSGNYVAKEKGFYADEGIDMQLEPFSFEDPTISAVIEGRADFGITGADELLMMREKGEPIKAVAVIYKINPVCAYSLKESGIEKPEDMIGKTVGIEKGLNVEYLYSAMMSKLDINRSQITAVMIGYDATELLAGETDVSTGYVINEPHQAVEAGYEVNTILMADYGVNMYADVLFTTEKMIQENPEAVRGFVKATMKGWQYSIENQEEAVDIVLKYATDRTKSHEKYMLEQSIPLIHTGDSALGEMASEEWNKAKEILLEQGLIETDINVEDAFTNEFLK